MHFYRVNRRLHRNRDHDVLAGHVSGEYCHIFFHKTTRKGRKKRLQCKYQDAKRFAHDSTYKEDMKKWQRTDTSEIIR